MADKNGSSRQDNSLWMTQCFKLCGHMISHFCKIYMFVKMLEKYKKHPQFVVYSKLGCGLS